jgi:hypothetical protein
MQRQMFRMTSKVFLFLLQAFGVGSCCIYLVTHVYRVTVPHTKWSFQTSLSQDLPGEAGEGPTLCLTQRIALCVAAFCNLCVIRALHRIQVKS